MDNLPQDPMMLISAINMLLRDDEFDTLEDLCGYFDRDVEAIKAQLLAEGYVYSETQRQMRPIGFDAS